MLVSLRPTSQTHTSPGTTFHQHHLRFVGCVCGSHLACSQTLQKTATAAAAAVDAFIGALAATTPLLHIIYTSQCNFQFPYFCGLNFNFNYSKDYTLADFLFLRLSITPLYADADADANAVLVLPM